MDCFQQGTLSVGINATDIFDRYEALDAALYRLVLLSSSQIKAALNIQDLWSIMHQRIPLIERSFCVDLAYRPNKSSTIITPACLFYIVSACISHSSTLPSLEISQLSISQSVECPLTTRDTAVISGNLSSHNGNGSGSILVCMRRVLASSGWAEVRVWLFCTYSRTHS